MEHERNILVVGHRGAKGYAFENSLSSMTCALDLGVDMIELDVFRCRSGQLVVFHDDLLDELTNSTGPVEAKTLEELKQVQLRNGESIPSLLEVLHLIDGRTNMNIELKGRRTAIQLVKLLRTLLNTTEWRMDQWIVSSFHPEELAILKQYLPELKTGLLTDTDPLDALQVAHHLGAHSIHLWYPTVDSDIVTLLHKKGYKVIVYTVDHPVDIQSMIDCGVDGIISDFPDRVRELLRPVT